MGRFQQSPSQSTQHHKLITKCCHPNPKLPSCSQLYLVDWLNAKDADHKREFLQQVQRFTAHYTQSLYHIGKHQCQYFDSNDQQFVHTSRAWTEWDFWNDDLGHRQWIASDCQSKNRMILALLTGLLNRPVCKLHQIITQHHSKQLSCSSEHSQNV